MPTKFPVQFEPVELRPRSDGWTAQKQVAFIEALAETACVEEACRRVGMSDSSAYRLRRRECGYRFKRAWDAALDYASHRLEQAALGRALNGVPRPIFKNGEQVGEYRHYDERLTMFLLRSRRPHRFGKWVDRMLAPEPDDNEESAGLLEAELTEIAESAPLENGNDDDAWDWPVPARPCVEE